MSRRSVILRLCTVAVVSALAAGCVRTDSVGNTTAATTTAPTTAPTTALTATTSTTTAAPAPTSTTIPSIDALVEGLADLPFAEFLEASYGRLISRDPEFLTSLRVADRYGLGNDRLNDLSDSYLRQTQNLESAILELLHARDRDALSPAEQTSYDVYEWYLDELVRGHEFMYHDNPIHYFLTSYNDNLLRLFTEDQPMATKGDAEDYISRLKQIRTQVDQLLEGLEIRRDMGVVPPRFILLRTLRTLRGDLGSSSPTLDTIRADTLPLFTVFRDKIEQIDELDATDRDRLLAEARMAVTESFVPAWLALIDHLNSIEPLTTNDAGVWRLPDGDAYYAYLLRDQTSTDLTPDDIHQIGLEAVERIRTEMRAVFDDLGYPQDVGLGRLRKRAAEEAGFLSGSTADGRRQVLETFESLIDEAERRSLKYFDLLPKAEVIVVPEQVGAGGFYMPASVDGTRPGVFHAGVAGGRIPTCTMPTITYHETVPGHHLQIALAQELDLPSFRRYYQYNAYAEGWALYAERLASEMGLYEDDPYGDIGRLELELLRAVRLVTDTGIHSMGWTRQKAQGYMNRYVPTWAHEVERYVVVPAQATGYLIGQQEILRLREKAADALGNGFDIAEFHDVVLGGGSIPLDVLERRIDDYITGKAH
ncbi:hypothetical protein BMS3Abin02_00464 [bacterium BMS3Abin02]|nr:hypothetical protein BMS3Abin02_00464 [bacterium BMS3Abin02]